MIEKNVAFLVSGTILVGGELFEVRFSRENGTFVGASFPREQALAVSNEELREVIDSAHAIGQVNKNRVESQRKKIAEKKKEEENPLPKQQKLL